MSALTDYQDYYERKLRRIDLLTNKVHEMGNLDNFVRLSNTEQIDVARRSRILLNDINDIVTYKDRDRQLDAYYKDIYNNQAKKLRNLGYPIQSITKKTVPEINDIKRQQVNAISDGVETANKFDDMRFEMSSDFNTAIEKNNIDAFRPRNTLINFAGDDNQFVDTKQKQGVINKKNRQTQRQLEHLLRTRGNEGITKLLPEMTNILNQTFPNGKIAIPVIDKNGREYVRNMDVGDYAEGWYIDNSARARTEATLGAANVAGVDLVDIVGGITDNSICDPFVSIKTFSLSGKTPGYPKLEKYPPYHPNCSKTMVISPKNADIEQPNITKTDEKKQEKILDTKQRTPPTRPKKQVFSTLTIVEEGGGEENVFDIPNLDDRQIFKINKSAQDKIIKELDDFNADKFLNSSDSQKFAYIKNVEDGINNTINTEINKMGIFNKGRTFDIQISYTTSEQKLGLGGDVVSSLEKYNKRVRELEPNKSWSKISQKTKNKANQEIVNDLKNITKSRLKDTEKAVDNFGYTYNQILSPNERNIIDKGLKTYTTQIKFTDRTEGSYHIDLKDIRDGDNVTASVHEIGHSIIDSKTGTPDLKVNKDLKSKLLKNTPTEYSTYSTGELWAEMFANYKLDPQHLKDHYPVQYKYMRKVEKSGYNKFDFTLKDLDEE